MDPQNRTLLSQALNERMHFIAHSKDVFLHWCSLCDVCQTSSFKFYEIFNCNSIYLSIYENKSLHHILKNSFGICGPAYCAQQHVWEWSGTIAHRHT